MPIVFLEADYVNRASAMPAQFNFLVQEAILEAIWGMSRPVSQTDPFQS